MKIFKINTLVYLVSKGWKNTKNLGAKVICAKVTGYQNIDGIIFPIVKQGRIELDPTTNYIFTVLEDAVDKIRTKK